METDLARESDSKYEVYLAQARLKQEVAQGLTELMHREGVSATELARRLGKSKGHISKLLSGDSNLTLDTVAEVYFALGRQVHPVMNKVADLQSPIDECSREYIEATRIVSGVHRLDQHAIPNVIPNRHPAFLPCWTQRGVG